MRQDQHLKLSIAGLDEAGLDFSFVLDARWFADWREQDPSLDFRAPDGLAVALHVQRHGRDILVRGRLQGSIELSCSRCLATFAQAVAGDFDLLLAPGPAPLRAREEELSEEDLTLDYYTGDEVNLESILREQILLLLPLKPLCDDNCQGLCPRCGADLNRGACACPAPAAAASLAEAAKLHLKKS
jgi:uncharacterized protein